MDGLKLLEWKKEIENQLESTKYTYDPEISISGDNIIIDMSGVARIGRVVVRSNKGVECEIRRIGDEESLFIFHGTANMESDIMQLTKMSEELVNND